MSSALPETAAGGTLPGASMSASARPSVPWAGVVHDVRGAATAIEALAHLVAADAPSLPPSSRDVLGLIQARAEQLAVLCDALACLHDGPSGRLPLGRILHLAGARLQKFLDRAAITLKLPGEIPDMEVEARPLGLVLQAILVTAVNARDASQPAIVEVKVNAVKGSAHVLLDMTGPGWSEATAGAVAALDGRDAATVGTLGLASAHALQRLRAGLALAPLDGSGWRVSVGPLRRGAVGLAPEVGA